MSALSVSALEDAVAAAAAAMSSTVPNRDGVLWEFDDVIDQRTGQTQPHPVTLKDAARAALHAVLPIVREEIAKSIETKYLGADFGRSPMTGQESPDALLHEAFNEGLRVAIDVVKAAR